MAGMKVRAAVESCLGSFVLYKASAQHPARERSSTSVPRVGWHLWVPQGPAALLSALLHSTGFADELFPLSIMEPAGRLDHLLVHPLVYINQPCVDQGDMGQGAAPVSQAFISRLFPVQPKLVQLAGQRGPLAALLGGKQRGQTPMFFMLRP